MNLPVKKDKKGGKSMKEEGWRRKGEAENPEHACPELVEGSRGKKGKGEKGREKKKPCPTSRVPCHDRHV